MFVLGAVMKKMWIHLQQLLLRKSCRCVFSIKDVRGLFGK